MKSSGSVEGVDEAGDVVPGDPDLAGQQRLLHEAVVGDCGFTYCQVSLSQVHILGAFGGRTSCSRRR